MPYQVNKARAIQAIADLVKDKKLEGISDLRDESSREGIRAVVETRRDAITGVVLNNLYQHSSLFQDSFGATMLSIDHGQPRTLALKAILERFIAHRRDVVTRRTRYELRKAKEREHILLGYQIALDHIDEIIALIKASASRDEASRKLQSFYSLSEIQAKAILEMQLQRLTGLEKEKILTELAEVQALITRLSAILSSEKLLLDVIKDELREVKTLFADPRRTEIQGEASDLSDEDLIAEEDMVVTFSHQGYVKRTRLALPRPAARRAGKGRRRDHRRGLHRADLRRLDARIRADLHQQGAGVLAQGARAAAGRTRRAGGRRSSTSSRSGRRRRLRHSAGEGAQLAEEGRRGRRGGSGRGRRRGGRRAAAGAEGEDVEESEATRVAAKAVQVAAGPFILFVTQNGLIKRTRLEAFARPRPSGLKALSIEDDDTLVSVMHAKGDEDVIIGTSQGMAIRFDQKEVRSMGRAAFGVKGITLEAGDRVVGAELAKSGATLFTMTENGYGKRTAIEEYRLTHRGGKGVIDIKTGDRNGNVVAVLQVTDADQVMIITNKGTLIRSRVADISIIGRNTQGVRVMSLSQDGEKVSAARAPREREADAAAAVVQDATDEDGAGPRTSRGPAVCASQAAQQERQGTRAEPGR